jgi:hypothetical protein
VSAEESNHQQKITVTLSKRLVTLIDQLKRERSSFTVQCMLHSPPGVIGPLRSVVKSTFWRALSIAC